MRLLTLAAVAAVAYAFGRAREYRAWLTACETPTPQAESYDEVQPADPHPVVVTLPNTLSTTEVGHIRGWLQSHPDVLAELYEAKPVPSYLHPST